MTVNNHTIINKKWTILILFILYNKKKKSYKSIKNILQIPNSTLALRLNELVQCKYINKFIYGSINKPHYTDYEITNLGLDYINNMLSTINY